MEGRARLPVAVAMLVCLIMVQTAAAHRHMLQEVLGAAGPEAAAPGTPADPTNGVDANPELDAAAAPSGRAGYDYPDRIPGPPALDPHRQGMYKGKYRWECSLAWCCRPHQRPAEETLELPCTAAHCNCALCMCRKKLCALPVCALASCVPAPMAA
jgi:hypothetical protein